MKKNSLIIIGIQGGKGSFNEEAAFYITSKKNIKNFQIKYLYTTEKVLKNLNQGKIDYGIFALYNSTAGLVEQSLYPMAKYKFKIVEKFSIEVRHFLMKRKDTPFEKIKTIIAHPQVFKQCQKTLSQKYPHLKLISGKGDMIDTGKAAEALFLGKLPKETAVVGSKKLAQIYNFDIIDSNLQDNKNNNFTTFLLVK